MLWRSLTLICQKKNGFELYNEIRKIDDKVNVCFVKAFDIQREGEDDLGPRHVES